MMYKIKKAKFEDVNGIAKVHVQSWREAYRGIVNDDYLKNLKISDRRKKWQKIYLNQKKIIGRL